MSYGPYAIDEAIASYAEPFHWGTEPPYDGVTLAEIYQPRVRELLTLRSQGYTHAVWKWDAEAEVNRWHGVTDTT